ncbi:SdiA-regulated domain-containing protein [Ekhidna sp.]|uniref:SdiA-regulated domain-containing protein n=1 Tax=Ekhidna sp. TaxID=2608089 RepID=UPI003CCB778A
MTFIKNIAPILLFIFLISLNQSCSSTSFGNHADSLFLVDDYVEFNYNVKRPVKKFFLPYVLEEVSGLTFKAPNSLLAVDDESGRMFEYDLKQKEISHSIGFHKAGDYEGIEMVGDTVFVLKSDGDIFQFPYTPEKEVGSKKHENILSSKNDTEGLGHDPKKNQLLIACKEDGGLGKKKLEGRGFYAFNFKTKKVDSSPLFVIGPKELETFWEKHKSFDYERKRIKFKPSAIATHPISGDYYILSSVGKMLVVVNDKGDLKATYPISPRVLGQPEGICFSPNGDLFISSEGEGDRGYILKFKMKPNIR